MYLDYKFDLMYSKRAFVHWYVGEGMEEVSLLSLVMFDPSLTSKYRVSSLRPVRISQRLRRITRRSVPILPMLRRKVSIREKKRIP